MKKKVFIFILPFLLAASLHCFAVKIMPLGNSITNGHIVPGGYRAQFWRNLEAAGLNCGVDIVGTQHDNFTVDIGDIDHEGHGGALIDQIASSINSWMDTTHPDIIMLEIGTNDIAFNVDVANAPTRLGSLIDKICAKLPTNGKLYVATIIPFGDVAANQRASNYNAALPAIIQTRQNEGKPVSLVDLNHSILLTDLSADNVHPSQAGYNKMGDFWFNVIKNDITSPCGDIVSVTRVAVLPTIATINPGSTQQLSAIVSPSNATNKNVSWVSNNTSIATVDANGLVTGVAAGTATITVRTIDGDFTATSAVTIRVPVTGVSVNPSALSINAGTTKQLTITLSPFNATNRMLSWGSNKTSVATVNGSGAVTGVAAGSAIITVRTKDGNFTATSNITVIDSPIVNPPSQTVIIEAGFLSATDGSVTILNGTTPDVTNLPGSLWVESAGWNAYGHPQIGQSWNGQTKNVASMEGGSKVLGISIKSDGTYIKPIQLHLSADIKMQGDVYKAKIETAKAILGFYPELPALNSGTPLAKFTGLELKGDGSLTLIENGTTVNSIVAVSLSGDSIVANQLYTLAYDVNTSTGGISNVSLQGSASAYNFTSTAFTDLATAYVGFGAGGDNNIVAMDNFIVSDASTPTQTKNIIDDCFIVYPNPAINRIYFSKNVSEAALFSLQGKKILSAYNEHSLDVSALSKGLYIVRTIEIDGNKKSTKLEIR
ncbi:MAG: Ig-like domain-containing protein [Paludibacter sp.]